MPLGGKMIKRDYAAGGHFVRAALDFMPDGYQAQKFGEDPPDFKRPMSQEDTLCLARTLFATGQVLKAWIHFNEGWKGDKFHIVFAPQSKSRYKPCPSLEIKILSFTKLQERAEFYKKDASVGSRVRKPRKKSASSFKEAL